MPPLEIQVLAPSRRTWPGPSGVAVVVMAATSDPASGSESAKAAIASPRRRGGGSGSLSSSEPASVIEPGAEPLHGEGEIGKAVPVGQGLAGKAQGANVVARIKPAIGLRHGGPQPTGLPEPPHEPAAGGVHVV
jgi:hypothetical protein